MKSSIPYAVAFLLTIAPSLHAQTVSGVSGALTHGSTLTISGSSFGTKSIPGPVVWDSMESGSFSSKWKGSNSLSIGTESRHGNSHYCGQNNFGGGSGNGGIHAFFTGPDLQLGETWFAQYWFKLDNNFDWGTGSGESTPDSNLSNVKLFRMWSPGPSIENFVVATMGQSGGSLQYQTENVSNPAGRIYFGNTSNWAKGIWHLFQFEFKESTLGGNDGIFRWWVDGALFVDDHDIMTRQNNSDLKRPYILGFYNSWTDSNTDRDDFYIDDAYIDYSWARVEIGNNANYNLSTHREIQIPTAWSATQITVNVNSGSFTAGSPMYLFVVNASGQVSAGYPVTGGGVPPIDSLAPAPPSDLRVN